ncbi:MAG: CPBP family intramembrane metalloprotease [Bacteroidales bacterium]|nr:CPBP family intramembrane metalloprotease [Bacteroidales bacterium]
MPNKLPEDAIRMGIAGGFVFLIALPCAGLGWALCRHYCRPLLTPWQRPHARWNGTELLALFGLFLLLPSLVQSLIISTMGEDGAVSPETLPIWASALSATLVCAVGWGQWYRRHRTPQFLRRLPGQLLLGFATWPTSHVVVFAIYTLCLLILAALGEEPNPHPFSQLMQSEAGPGTLLLLGLLACVLAPLVEEFLFRGVLFDWSVQRQRHSWVILTFAILLTLASGQIYAVLFLGILCVAYGGWEKTTRRIGCRTPSRITNTVYATSALFAAVHSGVWPSPIPLFALGLFLGTLRARTGGIAAGVALHGLFNAVSYVYLLRGSA